VIFRWKRGQMVVALLCVLLLVVTAACSSADEDDGDPTATTAATTASSADSSPTAAEAPATETSPAATATEEESTESTATTGAQATATEADDDGPTATSTTAAGESTATEATGGTTPDTGTGDVEEVPDFDTLDPELLPNFSLTMNFDATNMSGTPQTTLTMVMEQSAIDNYHLNMETDGQVLEFWTIGDQSWTSVGGEVVESPTGPLFSPADLLQTSELIPEGLNAREDGNEEVNGRQTTKWVVDGADYVAYMNEQAKVDGTSTVEMTDGTGEVTVWIDEELNIMIKAEGDVAWNNSDDTQGTLVYDYSIHDIGSTADIVAPL
jgi:hypothetical protein